MNPRQVFLFRVFVHIGALIPLALMVYLWLTDGLSANPVQDLTFRTGKAALWLLVLSLAATPANTLLGFRTALKVRRALGLYAFLYVVLHFLAFVWLDYGLDVRLMLEDVGSKRFIFAGLGAFLILIPLAVTSTRGWMRRLGKNWRRLHNLVYLAAILAVVHFTWQVKSDIREPLSFGLAVVLLLLARVPAVRRLLTGWRTKLRLPRMDRRASGVGEG